MDESELIYLVPLKGICSVLSSLDYIYKAEEIGDSRYQVYPNCERVIPVLLESKNEDTYLTMQCRIKDDNRSFYELLGKVNHWNFASKISRCYLHPEDNSLFLELNYDCKDGVTIASLLSISVIFVLDAVSFVSFIFDN